MSTPDVREVEDVWANRLKLEAGLTLTPRTREALQKFLKERKEAAISQAQAIINQVGAHQKPNRSHLLEDPLRVREMTDLIPMGTLEVPPYVPEKERRPLAFASVAVETETESVRIKVKGRFFSWSKYVRRPLTGMDNVSYIDVSFYAGRLDPVTNELDKPGMVMFDCASWSKADGFRDEAQLEHIEDRLQVVAGMINRLEPFKFEA